MGKRLSEADARALMLAKGFLPSVPYTTGKANWSGVCLRCGQPGSPRYGDVAYGDQGCCGYCGGSKVDTAIQTGKMLAADLRPLVPYPGRSDAPWASECLNCGAVVSPSWDSIKQTIGTGCPVCNMRRMGLDRMLEADKCAAEMRDAGLEPLEPYPGLGKPWRCRCTDPTCSAVVYPTLGTVRGGGGCEKCGRRRATASLVARTQAMCEVEAARDGVVILGYELRPASTKRLADKGYRQTWITYLCAEGHQSSNTADNFLHGKRCRPCADAALKSARFLRTEDKCQTLATSEGYEVLGFEQRPSGTRDRDGYQHYSTYLNYRCPAGHARWVVAAGFVQGTRCASCADFGFDVNAPAIFYGVTDGEVLKGGISNNPRLRLSDHARQGLTDVVVIAEFGKGEHALAMEALWLEYVVSKPEARIGRDRLRDGHTEATLLTEDSLNHIRTLAHSLGDSIYERRPDHLWASLPD